MEYNKEVFRNNMKTLRRNAGLSQEKLAERINLSQHTISTYEKSNPNPTLDNLILISKYYNVSIEALLTLDLSEDVFNFGTRKSTAGDYEYSHFEGMTYYVYYLSERTSEPFRNGYIIFDSEYDKEHLFLHGTVYTGHNYDCKMVIEGNHTFYVYGTETTIPRRFHLGMYYPDFRDDTKFLAGLGLVSRIDSKKSMLGMRVAVTGKELDIFDLSVEDKLRFFLTDGKATSESFINREKDDAFREWVRGII